MLLADEASLDYWTLRDYLEAEVERRRATPNPRLNAPEPAHVTMRSESTGSPEKPHG